MTGKGPDAFRTISEAAAEVGAPPHVLRFWETRFSFIRPVRRGGGQRFYRPRDIEVLSAVRRRLHEEGLSIREVQRLSRAALLEGGESPAEATPAAAEPPAADSLARLRAALSAAVAAKTRLDALLHR
ncbi:MAG TPA: MerR family transcriptional regulator [Caulobacteraceae bacterium]|nr:MerR family transcriptional regulator [Caulobacteraceae bacterium]